MIGEVWVSIVEFDGRLDVELLDSEPTEGFRDGVRAAAHAEREILSHSIRVGNVNGGDSVETYRVTFGGV